MIKFILISMLILSPIFRGSVSPLAFGSLQILTAAGMLIWFLHMSKEQTIRFKRTWLDMPLLLFFLLSLVSLFRTTYLHDSLVEIFKMVNLTAIFYLTVNNIQDRRDIVRLANVIVITSGILSIFGLIQYLGGITNYWWDRRDFLSSVYVNHNHFAGLLELSMPLCICLALREKEKAKKLFYSYIFLIMLIAFMFSMSRGAWLSLSVSILVMFILLYKERFIKPEFFIAIFFLITIAFLFIKKVDLSLFLSRVASYKEFNLEGRFEIWKGTLRIIQDAPFFGIGPGAFIYYFPKYRPFGFNLFANYAHNDYLQLASELGVISLFCVICMFFLIVKKGIMTYSVSHSNFKKAVSLGAVIGVLSIIVHSLVDFNLRIPANVIFFTILSGLIFSVHSKSEQPDRYLVIKLNKAVLYLVRPIFIVFIFIWIFYIGRLVMAEAILAKTNLLEPKEQISGLNDAIDILPGNSEYYRRLGRIYTSRASISLDKERDLLLASECYRRASEINPMDGWSWFGRADASLYLGNLNEAKELYKKALELDPDNSYYMKRLGDALVRAGEVKQAASIFERVSKLEKNSFAWLDLNHDKYNPDFYIEKGDFYYREGKLRDALNMYRLAGDIGPHSDYIKIKIASLLERMGKGEDSMDDIAASDSPNNSEKLMFLNSRARYCISAGKYKDAEILLDKAFSISNRDCSTLQNKIDLLQRQKRPFAEVRPYMERLLELNDKRGKGVISEKDMYISFDLEKDGLMLSSGIKDISFMLPLGLIDVKIVASGTFAEDEWPHMLVKMNSTPILSAYVYSDSYTEFNAPGFSQEGINHIKIEFSNDYFDRLSGKDRNLNINKIILEYRYPDYES
jgi:O-antigen ligase/tetratricopeptide (TPR) repeat protein